MILHEIQKQKLLQEPLEPDVLKLARAIYNTYIEDNYELFLDIKITILLNLFNLPKSDKSLKYIKYLFEELNEPLCVKNFKFFANVYPMRFIYFCTYSIQNDFIEIELSEEYLYAIENYMIDPYLTS